MRDDVKQRSRAQQSAPRKGVALTTHSTQWCKKCRKCVKKHGQRRGRDTRVRCERTAQVFGSQVNCGLKEMLSKTEVIIIICQRTLCYVEVRAKS